MEKYLKGALSIAVVVLVATTVSRAGCSPEKVSDRRMAALKSLLAPNAADFRAYAERASQDGKLRFALYTVADTPAARPRLYLAATTSGDEEHVFFLHDIIAYLPPVAQPPNASPLRVPTDPPEADRGPIAIDGCLNSLLLAPDFQAVHANVFVKFSKWRLEAASDVLFVLRGAGFIQPALEMKSTSRRVGDSQSLTDSLIAVLPATGAANEVIWEQFDQGGSGMATSSRAQNTVYKWDTKGFHPSGTLGPDELQQRLKNAIPLPRSDAITPLRVEYTLPGPNQPAP
jgi:hypothetical protein